MAAYREVKRRLAELLPAGGVLVRNDDDEVVSTYEPPGGARAVPYTRAAVPSAGVGVADGWIVAAAASWLRPGTTAVSCRWPTSRCPASTASPTSSPPSRSACFMAVDPEAIAAAVRGFAGVEHRLEPVAEIAGVRYVNDSQGTQPDAVIAAVRSFGKPLVLIAGGRSKGVPVDALAAAVAERVTAAVLIGETADELAAAFGPAGLERIEHAASMEAAVALATAIAREHTPSTVLLSPAAASFDMYRDYEARGAAFKAAVAAIASGQEAVR